YSLDTAANQVKQIANLEEKIYTPLCASDGVVYIYGEAQNLYALDAESGARLWSLPLTSK
ncbi:MAG TPA: PQQ-binding-like beta-propeller repeat protein, partial [Dehalococcoidales bacterium]|nr:PQQ-binding-like beta-propeller repeat protein [Dehalococcoidales bacterium]